MRRTRWIPALIVAGLLVSCGDDLEPPTTGSIALIIQLDLPQLAAAADPDGGPGDSTAGPAVNLGVAAFTSARASATGPTPRSVNLQLVDGFWEGELTALNPGSYTVTVEGLIDGEVDARGVTQNVAVVAGSQTPASVTLQSFVPTLTVGLSSPTRVVNVPVSVSSVPNADAYRVEWANNPDFTGASGMNLTATSGAVNLGALGTFYFRARAVAGTTVGRPGAERTIEVLGDSANTGADAATALALGFGANANGRLTALNIVPGTDEDWFTIEACTGDTVVVETFAARLTPVSGLNTYLRVTNADGQTVLAENDDLDGSTTDSRVETVLVGDDRYRVQISSGTSATTGHYEFTVTVRPGAKDLGTYCQNVKQVVVSPPTANLAPGATVQLSAEPLDTLGATVPNVKFLWVSSNTNVAVVDTTGLVTARGGGSATITALGEGEPGNAVVTVSGPALGTPTHVAFSAQPGSTTAGDAFSPAIEVEIRDANGNVVPDARNAVTLALASNPGSASLYGTTTVSANNGVARFTGIVMTKAAAGYTLSATSGALTGATSSGFNIVPGAPSKLSFIAQPGSVEGNTAFAPPVTAAVTDQYGNVVTTATNAITMDFATNVWASVFSSGSSLLGTTTANAVNGVATFSDLRVDKPGPGYRLAATAAGLADGASNPFNVTLTVADHRAAKLGDHTCAIVSGGGMYCWGYGGNGQLGDGRSESDSVPRPVAGGLAFDQITVGARHSCGLVGVPGDAYCWGYNGYGQLGNNSTNSIDIPVAVQGGLQFSSLSAGRYHTCGISGGTLYCWGRDGSGQLGDDASLANKLVPTPVAGGLTWQNVAAGGEHTCAVTTGGSAYCWGYDGYGQLGNDTARVNQPTPALVAGGNTWQRLDPGYYHTCGVDASTNGWCWGANFSGMLGVDTTVVPVGGGNVQSRTPKAVVGGISWAHISTGWEHTCGRSTTGDAYCWGANYDGQLGDGTFTRRAVRTAVSGGLTFDRVYVSGYHSCGRSGTQLWCWGAGYSGQLGHGATGRETNPVQIVQ